MGAVERDWVMRVVQQLAELLARVLKLKVQQRYDEAAQVLEAGCLTVLGLEFSALTLVDSLTGAQLLSEVSRIRTFARLLEELASVHREAGALAEARACSRHALEMYLEVLARRSDDEEALSGLHRLTAQVATATLHERYRALLLKTAR
jgi:hypothetical protein